MLHGLQASREVHGLPHIGHMTAFACISGTYALALLQFVEYQLSSGCTWFSTWPSKIVSEMPTAGGTSGSGIRGVYCKQDLMNINIRGVYCWQDRDNDMRGVAAEALLPTTLK